MEIKKWRVVINQSWTSRILFEKLFYLKRNADKEFKKLCKKYKGDKEKCITIHKIPNFKFKK